MIRRIVFHLGFLFLFLSASTGFGQPFDLMIPESSLDESLSNELRKLQEIERDLSLEKLNRPSSKLQGLIELGDLRATQGKMEEAQRFYEMAMQIQPENMLANKGLAMIYYNTGQFGKAKSIFERLEELYPLSDALKNDVEKVRANLKSTAEAGLTVHEDNRGISEVNSSIEGYFPSFQHPKLSAKYRYENFTFDNGTKKTDSQVISGTFQYNLNHRSLMAFTYGGEQLQGRTDLATYRLHGVTGSSNLHFAGYAGREIFKENFSTVFAGMTEDYLTLVLFGEINDRARISQTMTASDISDDNSRRHFNTNLLYFITRAGIPLLSLELELSQTSFARQNTVAGAPYSYWTPSDFRGSQLKVSWERGVGAHWWYGLESHVVSNSYRDPATKIHRENGLGFMAHLSYRFDRGRIYTQFANTVREYYRERMLGVFSSIDF